MINDITNVLEEIRRFSGVDRVCLEIDHNGLYIIHTRNNGLGYRHYCNTGESLHDIKDEAAKEIRDYFERPKQ